MIKFIIDGKRYAAILFGFLFSSILITACSSGNGSPGLKNTYKNDLESYEGWQGINGWYLYDKDAHSGQHCIETNATTAVYSLTYSRKLSALTNEPVKKISMSIWVKTSQLDSKGDYVLSFEENSIILSYFAFSTDNFVESTDKWYQVKGEVELPKGIGKNATMKIYFWNKGQSTILVDDFEFSIL
jgi:hypothetical protein